MTVVVVLGACVDKSRGIPSVVRELCTYLVDNSHLTIDDANDAASLKQRSMDLHLTACPSRENLIRSLLDQLPTRQAMVLKSASVLGHRFRAGMLHELLPIDMGLTAPSALQAILKILASGDFIKCVSGNLNKDVNEIDSDIFEV